MARAIQTQSSTLEGQVLEILNAISEAEKNSVSNPQNLHNVDLKWSIGSEKIILQGNFVFALVAKMNGAGELVLIPAEYLIDIPINGAE
jgi:hypothetical protein